MRETEGVDLGFFDLRTSGPLCGFLHCQNNCYLSYSLKITDILQVQKNQFKLENLEPVYKNLNEKVFTVFIRKFEVKFMHSSF